jgi:uncharacterized membrane protein YjjP (DUF1212 family)
MMGASAEETVKQPIPVHLTLRFISRLGHSLLATGETVTLIQQTLQKIAEAYGLKRVNILALPTVLFVKFEDEGDTKIEFRSEGLQTYRFDQVEEIYRLAAEADKGELHPLKGLEKLELIHKMAPKFNYWYTIGGHALISAGIVMVLRPTLSELLSAILLGLVVGWLKYFAAQRPMILTVLPTLSALLAASVAFFATRHGFAMSSIKVLIASVVTFLPGGSMAIATIELSSGDVVSGSSRFVNSVIQIVLLTLGLVTAAMIIKIPADQAFTTDVREQLGWWAPWIGVALFGFGQMLHLSIPRSAMPWMIFCLYWAYVIEVLGDVTFGGYMGIFLGAMAVTPLAYVIQYKLNGPPMLITFLPSLWLLVPTSVALVGLTEFVASNHVAGIQDFAATIFSIIAAAIGCLIGIWFYNFAFDPLFERTREFSKRTRVKTQKP